MTKQSAAFYVKEFNGMLEDMCCINMALLFDAAIMIVGRPLCANEVPGFSKTISWMKDVVVILAITFCNGTVNECGSSYVVWLLVASASESKPLQITSWRRQGFGHLMLIMLIKRSTIELLHFLEKSVCREPLNGVDIYLQYTQVDAQAFYQSCGFVQINSRVAIRPVLALAYCSLHTAALDSPRNTVHICIYIYGLL